MTTTYQLTLTLPGTEADGQLGMIAVTGRNAFAIASAWGVEQ